MNSVPFVKQIIPNSNFFPLTLSKTMPRICGNLEKTAILINFRNLVNSLLSKSSVKIVWKTHVWKTCVRLHLWRPVGWSAGSPPRAVESHSGHTARGPPAASLGGLYLQMTLCPENTQKHTSQVQSDTLTNTEWGVWNWLIRIIERHLLITVATGVTIVVYCTFNRMTVMGCPSLFLNIFSQSRSWNSGKRVFTLQRTALC